MLNFCPCQLDTLSKKTFEKRYLQKYTFENTPLKQVLGGEFKVPNFYPFQLDTPSEEEKTFEKYTSDKYTFERYTFEKTHF